jgi:hypothetical protein
MSKQSVAAKIIDIGKNIISKIKENIPRKFWSTAGYSLAETLDNMNMPSLARNVDRISGFIDHRGYSRKKKRMNRKKNIIPNIINVKTRRPYRTNQI